MENEKKIVDEIIQEIDLMQEEHSEDIKNGIHRAVDNIMFHGMAPKDALAIDNQTIQALSQDAYQQYNSGKYNEALHLFSILAVADGSYPYLFGMAACNHMMKEYRKAADAYMKCALLEPKDPTPYYHAADCYLHLNEIVSAMIALQMVVNRIGENAEYSQMKDRARLMLEKLSQKNTSEEKKG